MAWVRSTNRVFPAQTKTVAALSAELDPWHTGSGAIKAACLQVVAEPWVQTLFKNLKQLHDAILLQQGGGDGEIEGEDAAVWVRGSR